MKLRDAATTTLKRTIPVLLLALVVCLSPAALRAGDQEWEFRIGLIGADPGQLLREFSPLADYLKNGLRDAGVRKVTVIIAQDLNELRGRIQKEQLDFILTSTVPIQSMELDCRGFATSVVAVPATGREETAVFFVRKDSPVQRLTDLRGKTLAFGDPWSTTGYALAVTALAGNKLAIAESTDSAARPSAVRYLFAGEPINQAFRVITKQSDAGVFGSSNWDSLPRTEQSVLRIIHRTGTVTRLIGSFHPTFPPDRRAVVEQALLDMAGSKPGRSALAAAHLKTFDRLADEDRRTLQRLERQMWYGEE